MNRAMMSQLGKQLAQLERELIALKRTPDYDRGVRDCANMLRHIAEGEQVFNIAVMQKRLAEILERELLKPKANTKI